LTSRKLMPALAHLDADGLLDSSFAAIGVGRQPIGDEAFRQKMDGAIRNSVETGRLKDGERGKFLERLRYVSGDLLDARTYAAIAESLAAVEGDDVARRGRLFYFAIPPSIYPEV